MNKFFLSIILVVSGIFSIQIYSQTTYPIEQPDIGYPVTNGSLNVIKSYNNTMYVGGDFTYIGPNTGHDVVVDTTGQKIPGNLRVDGDISQRIADGNGGYYICGSFDFVGGIVRKGLAQIDSNGVLTPWNPNIDGGSSGTVSNMIIYGGVMYIAGSFSLIGGVTRNNLATIDLVTGAPTSWNPSVNSSISTMSIYGNRLYVGGAFTNIGGTGRNRAAAFNISTGLLLGWNPNANNTVSKIIAYNDKVYVAGTFFGIGVGVRNALAELDTTSGYLTTFNAQINSGATITDMLLENDVLYISGTFTAIYITPRTKLAAVNRLTGGVTSWYPQADANAYLVKISDGKVMVAGSFTNIGGGAKRHLALLDTITGGLLPSFDVKTDGLIKSVVESNGKIYISGFFVSYGGEYRTHIAAFDQITKQIKPFAPVIKRAVFVTVYDIAFSDGLVYLGGAFDSINGQYRRNIAAVDTLGVLQPFNPDINNYSTRIKEYDNDIYFCGTFTTVNGTARNSIAAVNKTTGVLLPWNPSPSAGVSDFVIEDSIAYMGGNFTAMGGVPRNRLAASNINTGALLAWNPNVTGSYIRSMAFGNGVVYAGGQFTAVGSKPRNNVAAIDAFTGQVMAWDPNPDDVLYSLFYDNGIVYLAGSFDYIGLSNIWGVAAIDAVTGQLTPWMKRTPAPSSVNLVTISNNTAYLGGISSYYFERNLLGLCVIPPAQPLSHHISGTIYHDSIVNCSKQLNETGLSSIIINSLPDNSYVGPDDNGIYKIGFQDSVAYSLQALIPERLQVFMDAACPPAYNINLTTLDPADSSGFDFGITGDLCPVLRINVASTGRRRCVPGQTSVTYINEGFGAQYGVEVHVKLPLYVLPLSTTLPYTMDMTDTSMVFNIDTLLVGESGLITIFDSVACDTGITGLTQCTKTWITPINTCYNNLDSALASWDNSSLSVSGRCIPGTGIVEFKIKNTGTGNMSANRQFRIFENNLIDTLDNYQLLAGDSLVLTHFAGGKTLRIETDQLPGHPGDHHPEFSIEACRINTSDYYYTGYINTMPANDEDLEEEISCMEIVDSFDPNEKNVSPEGVGMYHIVDPETFLNYDVHFQNTGTAVAFKVVVVDTLSPYLDISTFEPGAYSHSYTLSVSGTGRPILKFTFDDINLTDSLSDVVNSMGFFEFKISPYVNTPIGTVIENFVDIYFDYNTPVRTNTAWVTIDTVALTQSNMAIIAAPLEVMPTNCLGDSIVILSHIQGEPIDFQWYKNNVLISGATDSLLVLDPLVMSDTGMYHCKAEGLLNTVITSQIYLDVINPVSIAIVSDDTSICEAQSATLTINALGDNVDYQWYFNGVLLPTDTLYQLYVINANAGNSGNYYCNVSNVCRSVNSDSVLLGVYPFPAPVVIQNNDTLSASSSYITYQWYYNSNPVTGATDSNFVFALNGSYYLEVTDVYGCQGMSNSINITTASVTNINETHNLSIQPNPAGNNISVSVTDKAGIKRVCIYSIEGKLLIDERSENRVDIAIDISTLVSGVYILECYSGNIITKSKVVKY